MARPEEYLKKAEELKATESELEEKKKELSENGDKSRNKPAQTEEPEASENTDDSAENEDYDGADDGEPQEDTDRRDEFARKTAQLVQIRDRLFNQEQELERKSDAGADGNDENKAAKSRGKVGKAELEEFDKKLREYRDGKANLDERIRNNQNWWKLRSYGNMSPKSGTNAAADYSQKDERRPRSVTAWAINAIINKHADYMDNYPEAICLPVEKDDVEAAKQLSYVIPAVYEKADFEQVYSDTSWYKLIEGTSVTSYLWDSSLLNGLGDISIKKCNILNLFCEPGVCNIQDSEYFFHTQLISNEKLKAIYADVEGIDRLAGQSMDIVEFDYDDYVKKTDMSLVIDVYYHRKNSNGKNVLHYCKYVNDILLFSSENDDKYAETGYYKHGKYPFVFDTMFPVEGSPCGFGYVDIVKDPQKDIDEMTDNFNHNAKSASHRRYIVNKNGAVKAEDLADVTKEVIESNASLDEGNFRELTTNPLDSIYMTFYQERINEIKEVSNNRDVSSGGTMSGVTAASAIAAMQEAGSKTSRDQEASAYRAFKEGVYLVIELMSEFYDNTRYFRITGENGRQEFIGFNNEGVKEQVSPDGETSRKPIFDIKVKPQKRSAYSTLSQNELMKELWGLGVFDPQTATQSSLLVEFLEFEGKDKLLQKISQNGTIYQQLMQYQQIVLQLAQMYDSVTGGAEMITQSVQYAIQNGQIPVIGTGGALQSGRATQNELNRTNGNNIVDNAREQTRSRSEVRQ